MSFSEILKELRLEKGYTQTEVAKYCNVSTQCISSLEIGTRNPTGSTIIALSDFFGVSADYLLGRTDDLGAVLPPSYTPPLTAEEQRLLKSYRALDPRLQTVLWTMIETWEKPAKIETQKNNA